MQLTRALWKAALQGRGADLQTEMKCFGIQALAGRVHTLGLI